MVWDLWSCTHIPNIIDISGKKKSYGPDKFHWEEAEEAEEKIRLKQWKNQTKTMSPFVRRGDIIIKIK